MERALTPEDVMQTKRRLLVEPEDMDRSIVYFVGFGTEFVKIGKSTRAGLAMRIKMMQVSCPLQLEVVCIEDARDGEERIYHKKFASLRERGEWFRAEGELLTEMRRIHESMLTWDRLHCMDISGVFGDD